MSYVLKTIDLSDHRATGGWIGEPRLRNGRWTAGGGFWKKDAQPEGKHARFIDPLRNTADAYNADKMLSNKTS